MTNQKTTGERLGWCKMTPEQVESFLYPYGDLGNMSKRSKRLLAALSYMYRHSDTEESNTLYATHKDLRAVSGIKRNDIASTIDDLVNRGLITYKKGQRGKTGMASEFQLIPKRVPIKTPLDTGVSGDSEEARVLHTTYYNNNNLINIYNNIIKENIEKIFKENIQEYIRENTKEISDEINLIKTEVNDIKKILENISGDFNKEKTIERNILVNTGVMLDGKLELFQENLLKEIKENLQFNFNEMFNDLTEIKQRETERRENTAESMQNAQGASIPPVEKYNFPSYEDFYNARTTTSLDPELFSESDWGYHVRYNKGETPESENEQESASDCNPSTSHPLHADLQSSQVKPYGDIPDSTILVSEPFVLATPMRTSTCI